MRDMIKMVAVLTVLAAVSGGLLAAVKDATKDKIEYQQLKFVKGPAIKAILKGSQKDPIQNRFKIKDGDRERSFFVGVFGGKANAVAFETYGKGFSGDVGVMVGVNIENGRLLGIGVTTHSETPGVGSKAKDDPGFVAQFSGKPLTVQSVKKDGGDIDAMAGATITSQAVCAAVTDAGNVYESLKGEIAGKLKDY